jgi:hypothetical protein
MTLQPHIIEDTTDGTLPRIVQTWYALADIQGQDEGRTNRDLDERAIEAFVRSLIRDYHHSYESQIHATAAAMLVVGRRLAREFKLDPEQESWTGWEVFTRWQGWEPAPVRLLRYEHALWPGRERELDRAVPRDVWSWIQKRARELLFTQTDATPEQRQHWENILTGNMPYGLVLKHDI